MYFQFISYLCRNICLHKLCLAGNVSYLCIKYLLHGPPCREPSYRIELSVCPVWAKKSRVRSVWKKFCEYLPILTGKEFSLKLKGKVYATCVRSCLMHGSETWPMKVEHELELNRTEMSMIRWMCGVKLNERKKNEEL